MRISRLTKIHLFYILNYREILDFPSVSRFYSLGASYTREKNEERRATKREQLTGNREK